jgi:hypothetical protein
MEGKQASKRERMEKMREKKLWFPISFLQHEYIMIPPL